MDKKTDAIFNGHLALLSEMIRLLVNKGVLTPDEVKDVVTELVIEARQRHAEAGFDVTSMRLLKIIEGWKRAPRN
jgi:polyhydroxyalkanoate synthesis regulator phasin